MRAARCNTIELRAPEPVRVLGGDRQLARAAVELVELAVSLAAPRQRSAPSSPRCARRLVRRRPAHGEEVDLWLARAVAAAHGGQLGCETQDGLVRLSLSLVRE